MTKFVIHVAASEDGFIGQDNIIPWHMPTDLKRFRLNTLGRPVIMGMKTFASLQYKPLERRFNIVMTRKDNSEIQENADYPGTGVVYVGDRSFAKTVARIAASDFGSDEIVIAGGGEIYKEFLPDVDRVYMTVVHTKLGQGTKFPELDYQEWSNTLVKSREVKTEDQLFDQFESSYVVYDRTGT